MTAEDVNRLLALMKANYSYAFKSMTQEEKYMLLCTWTVTLQDLPADIVMLAAMQLVSKSKWLPTVAEIRAACRRMHDDAATRDSGLDVMAAAGLPFTPEQQQEYERLKARRRYIAGATSHLRSEDDGGLTVNQLLTNPALDGALQPGFLLQGGEEDPALQ